MIHYEQRDSIVILRIDHGKASALDTELLAALAERLDQAERSEDAAAVVLTGTGSIFSAGVDLFRVMEGGDEYLEEFLPTLTRSVKRLFTFPRPVIAAVNGHAVAGGCVLACACDYRIMARDGGTIGVPELRLGVPFPGVALEILRFATPGQHFQELVYVGKTYSPEEAYAKGLVDETVPADSLLERATEIARRFTNIPAASFSVTKREVRSPVLDQIARHEQETDPEVFRVWKTPEVHAAIKAYVEQTIRRPS